MARSRKQARCVQGVHSAELYPKSAPGQRFHWAMRSRGISTWSSPRRSGLKKESARNGATPKSVSCSQIPEGNPTNEKHSAVYGTDQAAYLPILAPPAKSTHWNRHRHAGSYLSPSRIAYRRRRFCPYSDCGRSAENCSTTLRAGYGDPSKRRCSWTRGRFYIRRPCRV